MINSQSQPNNLQYSQIPISEPTMEQLNKKYYADSLRQQMEEKKYRQQQEKINDRIQDLQMRNVGLFNPRGGGGAPIRDHFGNITTSRKNPMDPNSQSVQWFGAPILSNPSDQLSQSQFPSMVSMPSQRITNQSMINLPTQPYQDNVNQNQLNQLGDSLLQAEKRQKQMLLQRELLQQMDIADKKKQEEKLRIKRDKELDDIRILKEREDIERKMRDEFGIDKLEKRNLQETNFDVDGLKAIKRLEMLRYQNELIEQQNLKNARKGPRQRTPVQEVERAYKDMSDENMRQKIEQRIIKELPIEVEKTVRDTVNVELQRLRQEMNLQTNQVSEQVVQLKGQLLKANEERHYNEDQIRRLKEELKQTQIIDEIRQRELYQAFLNQEKSRQIIESTQRLLTPEAVRFTFPRRPRPYYNMADPYLGSNDDVNKDLHEIITDNSKMMPISYDYGKDFKFDKDRIEDKMLYSSQEIQENAKQGYQLKSDDLNIPDDFLNRQKLYVSKKYTESKPINHYDYENVSVSPQTDYVSLVSNTHPSYVMEDDEVKDVIQKYSNKLDKLDEIDAHQKRKDYNQMDYALQDLLEQQQNKINRIDQFKEHFEYNDFYSPDYQETNFYNKMGKILSDQI